MTLTDRELEVIRRIQAGAFPHPEFQAHPDYVDYFTHEKEVMPLEGGDEPKRRFIPSKVRIAVGGRVGWRDLFVDPRLSGGWDGARGGGAFVTTPASTA